MVRRIRWFELQCRGKKRLHMGVSNIKYGAYSPMIYSGMSPLLMLQYLQNKGERVGVLFCFLMKCRLSPEFFILLMYIAFTL